MADGIEYSIRSYWLTGQASVGALLRFGNITVVVADIRHWKHRDGTPYGQEVLAMSRLQGILKLNCTLRRPHVHERQQLASGLTAPSQQLPVVRFPAWLHCPECGLLSFLPWRGKPSLLDEVRCQCKSSPRLKPAPWIIASPNGLLTDFVWKQFAHGNRKQPNRCEVDTELYLVRNPETGEEVLRCDQCKSENTLKDVDQIDMDKWVGNPAWQPWDLDLKYLDALLKQGNSIDELGKTRALRLTDVRIHNAVTTSAVDIPPESRVGPRDLHFRIQRHRDYEKWKKIQNSNQLTSKLKQLSNFWNIPLPEIRSAWDDLDNGWPENLPGNKVPESTIELRAQEFKAFTMDWGEMNDEERFIVRDHSEAWKKHCEGVGDNDGARIEHLIAVDRLREVRVFQGFRRLGGQVIIRPDLVGEEYWTPAVELHGEGIFLSLDETVLASWENQAEVIKRAKTIQRRVDDNPLMSVQELVGGTDYTSARFLLLHSLAHLLIRELEFEAGVPAASIRERIYCCCDEIDGKMAGILLYTTSADQVGSLAGLSVLAEPVSFLRILRSALKHGEWCSFDPVCSEHEGSGPGALNRAACHGCCLLPEPSCEFNNCLLDRTFVVSIPHKDKIAHSFFGRGAA